MSYKLEKPYTDKQRADFVCEHQGLSSIETENAFYFLEDFEELQNDEIIDSSETESYKTAQVEKENLTQKAELQSQMNALDFKCIRALRENSIKDSTTGQTWLDYYTIQIQQLREQINIL